MNKSYKIKINPFAVDSTEIKIKLEQNVETLEFLSMSIDTKEIYGSFNSDYGVLIGRVIANGRIGVPNAKVSIFIPLSEEDENNGEIKSIYPYKTPLDINNDGKRYNLLPRVAQVNLDTGSISPKQPFGSFPIKPEVVTNSKLMNVHKKYYKYTATTNGAGDYMIFGVPVGVQTVHMSVDITDIGEFSMNPAAMVNNLGYSSNLFTDNNTRIKPSTDLTDLPHIETQEISVNILPFWGDIENFEIGITQQNFRIRAVLSTTFTIFGSVFTDGDGAMWGGNYDGGREIRELFRAKDPANATIDIASKRIGIVSEKIYYYPSKFTDEQINSGSVDPTEDMLILQKGEYTAHKRNGDFVFIINCNRNRIFRNENNKIVSLSDDSNVGVFSEFRGFLVIEYTVNEIPMTFTSEIGINTTLTPFRYRLKFPQYAEENKSFSQVNDDNTNAWRLQAHTFKYNRFYSLSKFHGLTFNATENNNNNQTKANGFYNGTVNNNLVNDPFFNVGIIDVHKTEFGFPSNGSIDGGGRLLFGANWMNLSVHLPQVGYMTNGAAYVDRVLSADHFTQQTTSTSNTMIAINSFFFNDNTQPIAAGDINTRFMARSDLNWTDIIEVPISDIKRMDEISEKGFKVTGSTSNLTGKYRNGTYIPNGWIRACPFGGGKMGGHPDNDSDPNTYFYKGFDSANCIEYLFYLGLIT